MKRILVRSIIFLSLVFAIILLNRHIFNLQETYWSPQQFTFQLPLPDEIREEHGFELPLSENQVEEVYLAGVINDWEPRNPAYKMEKAGSKKWQINVRLYPGKNLYKFVLYLHGSNQPIWVYDINNPHRVDDNFGGYNSVITRKDPKMVFQVTMYSLAVILFFYLIYLILDFISFLVFRYRLGLRAKIAIMVLLVSIMAITVNSFYNIYLQRVMAREAIIDSFNLIHLNILGAGVDLTKVSEDDQLRQLNELFYRFFRIAHARIQKNSPSNLQTFISTFILFDKNGEILEVFKRKEGMSLTLKSMKQLGYIDQKLYYHNFIFNDLLENIKKHPAKRFQAQFGPMPRSMMKFMSPLDRVTARLLGFKIVLQPVFIDQTLVGYYGGTIHSQVYGTAILSMVTVNLLTGLLVALFMLIYFLFFHKDPTEDYLFDRFFKRFNISKREQDVVQLLCMGYSNLDISERLFISEGTVKAHIYHVFQKADVTQRLELINLIKNLK